jgi:hypothetical protein
MNRLTIGLGSLLVFQAVLVATLWMVDPFQSVGQREFGAVLGAELGIVAIFLHLYLSGEGEYDQEWIAVGLAFIVLIGLLAYFVLTG